MPLTAGTRLGPYQILAPLGAGGMGEVYRARDARLSREVAIKVLREDVAQNAERRARFEKEARAVAALEHPNIVSVYDVGSEDGALYMVSELVRGESLRALLGGRALPIRKVLDIAVQLADGMATAHAQGITHRDLKPENIMIAPDGRLKILDFGLARFTAALPEEGATASVHTHAGSILGTVNYMSPEQARGLPADHRSDQFSFGLILYEMLTGKRAFQRDSTVQTMSAILTDEPPPIEAKMPAPLRWTMDRCLAKDAAQRYDSTRDLFQELRSLRDHLSEAFSTADVAPSRALPMGAAGGGVWKVAFASSVLALLLVSALAVYLWRKPAQDPSKFRFTPFAMSAEGQGGPYWSPDGKSVVYWAVSGGRAKVMLRHLNSPDATPLRIPNKDARPLGWSADGNRVFYRGEDPGASNSDTKPVLYSIATVGGEPERVMDVDGTMALAISPDSQALAAVRTDNASGLTSVWISSPIGAAWKAYSPAPFATKELYNVPRLAFSPDGRQILFARHGTKGRLEIWILPYPQGGASPRQVLRELPAFGTTPQFSWMPDSRHLVVARAAREEYPYHLWIVDTESNWLEPLTFGTTGDYDPAVSPDGQKILYTEAGGHLDINSVSLGDGAVRKLIATDRSESMAAWSARQPKFAYVTDRNGPFEIWIHSQDGTERALATSADFPKDDTKWFMDPTLSPEGASVIFTRIAKDGAAELWVLSLAGGAPVRLTNSSGIAECGGSFSPDGNRVAFLQQFEGKGSLVVHQVGSQSRPVLLKEDVGEYLPDWSPTGDWISYRDKNGWNLISPDGKNARPLGKIDTPHLAFSKDGKRLYGIRTVPFEPEHQLLFSLDIDTLRMKTIADLGLENAPATDLRPGIRFSLAPDGKSFIYSTAKTRSNLWLLEGFTQP